MTIIEDCVSSCCGAKIRVEGGNTNNSLACTMYYACTHCGNPCNWQDKETNLCISQWDKKSVEEAINDK